MKGRIKRPEKKQQMTLPRVGKVKTGYMNGSYPKSTDYFIPTGKYASHFASVFGDKPSKIEIVFIDNDPEISCAERYEIRDNSGRLYAYGNGTEFSAWNAQKERYQQFLIEDHPELMEKVQHICQSKTGWVVTLTLRFIIPKIRTVAGHWEYVTKGDKSSIPNIRNTFDHMLETSRNGSIVGIPFDLNVEFAKSNKPGIQSRYPVVSMVANIGDENMKIINDFVTGVEPKQIDR